MTTEILCTTMFMATFLAATNMSWGEDKEVIGQRPYEMEWANRSEPAHPPLLDFEDLTGWRVETTNADARFVRSREQQLWGKYVAKLTYRETGGEPEIRITPPAPIPVRNGFEVVSFWIFGKERHRPKISALFKTSHGAEMRFPMRADWDNWGWFQSYYRLSPDQIEQVASGSAFTGFIIRDSNEPEERLICFDNLAVFTEDFKPLYFTARPLRGVPMFPGQGVGTNTGPGELPFPTREETILPDNLTQEFTTNVRAEGDSFTFRYEGEDGTLIYRLEPRTGTLGDISIEWEGRGGTIRPCVGGGVYLATEADSPSPPESTEHLGTDIQDEEVVSRWRLEAKGVVQDVIYVYRLWKKSLVIDTLAPGGNVAEVRYGKAVGVENPRLVANPFYTYNGYIPDGRPAVVVGGEENDPLFLTGNTDWYLSNASMLLPYPAITPDGVIYNTGTRYIPKTNGVRVDCYERFFITLSPRYEEMLPTIPNPKSPWLEQVGTRLWKAHQSENPREDGIRFFKKLHRYGITEMTITDHEGGWRDGGESFTFRTRGAPEKGGDDGWAEYSRVLRDDIGYRYGPYMQFLDIAAVNEYWDTDMITRTPDNRMHGGWRRCYRAKPARSPEYCELLSPTIKEKFGFNASYLDVHTLHTLDFVDYDYRVPGAATFAATFYAYGETMVIQKETFQGPVFSEGGHHFIFSGLIDGNYAQDRAGEVKLAWGPWLVDFELRKTHDLCTNIAMGEYGMFYRGEEPEPSGRSGEDPRSDRHIAATIAFGHVGILQYEDPLPRVLRIYYMLQQLQSRYTLSSVDEIRYADADGNLLDTTAAVASGAYKRSQIVTRYENGCITAVNGNAHDERMLVSAYGKQLDLPPNGYAGWTEDGAIEVFSGEIEGHRADYAVTPIYIFIDSRDKPIRFPKASGNGVGICRILPDRKYEVILLQGSECGFAVDADRAVALDEERNEIGTATIRKSDGFIFVEQVPGAFSYLLSTDNTSK